MLSDRFVKNPTKIIFVRLLFNLPIRRRGMYRENSGDGSKRSSGIGKTYNAEYIALERRSYADRWNVSSQLYHDRIK